MIDANTLEFFSAQTQAFAETLARYQNSAELLEALLRQAYNSFAGNVEYESEGCPDIACHKGCASCCTLRVTATAPEILLIVRYLHANTKQDSYLNLHKRVAKTNKITCGQNETQRVKQQCPCPFISRGVCTIYPVRPLACRGHACYDKKACIEAAAGRLQQLPISEPYQYMRSLIQNALQSAMRDAGYAWASFEMIQAVSMGLSHPEIEGLWLSGKDVFFPATVDEVSLSEMAETFDQIKQLS